jgi:hypothetical protein
LLLADLVALLGSEEAHLVFDAKELAELANEPKRVEEGFPQRLIEASAGVSQAPDPCHTWILTLGVDDGGGRSSGVVEMVGVVVIADMAITESRESTGHSTPILISLFLFKDGRLPQSSVHFRLTETLGNFARYQIRPSEFEAWQHVLCERKKS